MATRIAVHQSLTTLQYTLIQSYRLLPKLVRSFHAFYRTLTISIMVFKSILMVFINPIWNALIPVFDIVLVSLQDSVTYALNLISEFMAECITLTLIYTPIIVVFVHSRTLILTSNLQIYLSSILKSITHFIDSHVLPFLLKCRVVALRLYPVLLKRILMLLGIIEALEVRIRPRIINSARWIRSNTWWFEFIFFSLLRIAVDSVRTFVMIPVHFCASGVDVVTSAYFFIAPVVATRIKSMYSLVLDMTQSVVHGWIHMLGRVRPLIYDIAAQIWALGVYIKTTSLEKIRWGMEYSFILLNEISGTFIFIMDEIKRTWRGVMDIAFFF